MIWDRSATRVVGGVPGDASPADLTDLIDKGGYSPAPITIATGTQFLAARAVARRMIRQGSGVILTITWGPASRAAVPNVGCFDVACAAIEGLWRTFAVELGIYGIRLAVSARASPG